LKQGLVVLGLIVRFLNLLRRSALDRSGGCAILGVAIVHRVLLRDLLLILLSIIIDVKNSHNLVSQVVFIDELNNVLLDARYL
jgi:hypothetical protein